MRYIETLFLMLTQRIGTCINCRKIPSIIFIAILLLMVVFWIDKCIYCSYGIRYAVYVKVRISTHHFFKCFPICMSIRVYGLMS